MGTTQSMPGRPGKFWVRPKHYPGGRVISGYYPQITQQLPGEFLPRRPGDANVPRIPPGLSPLVDPPAQPPHDPGGRLFVGDYLPIAREAGCFLGNTQKLPGGAGNFWVIPINYPASSAISGEYNGIPKYPGGRVPFRVNTIMPGRPGKYPKITREAGCFFG